MAVRRAPSPPPAPLGLVVEMQGWGWLTVARSQQQRRIKPRGVGSALTARGTTVGCASGARTWSGLWDSEAQERLRGEDLYLHYSGSENSAVIFLWILLFSIQKQCTSNPCTMLG